jgi:hypothetical protein
MPSRAQVIAKLRQLDWARGMRAGLAVAFSMVVCRALQIPLGWAALGAFEGNIVDNGGPYRSRFASIAMLMGAGSLGAVGASFASSHLAWALALTAVFAFLITYLRAAGPPFTSSSVIILVVYFVGLDHPSASLALSLKQAQWFLGGCAGAAALSLMLWPVYPFSHARRAIGDCYRRLARSLIEIDSVLALPDPHTEEPAWRERWFSAAHHFPSRMRSAIETARGSLGSVRARTPARTARGRNLAILLESVDILFARALVLIELAERSVREGRAHEVARARSRLAWLASAAGLVEEALRDAARLAAVQREGAALIATARAELCEESHASEAEAALFATAFHSLDLEYALLFETALEALTGIATGVDPVFSIRNRHGGETPEGRLAAGAQQRLRMHSPGKWELLRQNWTLASSAMRHALRTAAVCVASVLLVRTLHVPYGEWMALTAVIVLQPYVAHTLRKSLQRVGGTIAGGVLAALLAVFIHTPVQLTLAVSITAFFTLAWYAVDYAWYCFFLTPTFVLLTLHSQHGWNVAGIRAMDTILGAALALVAVRLLWTESEHLRLAAIFARSAAANSAYLSALRRFWDTAPEGRENADREILLPARRQAGLANSESEEALERLMMEPTHGEGAAVRMEHALSFATYSRRLTQGVTAVALLYPSPPHAEWIRFIDLLRARLQKVAALLEGQPVQPTQPRVALPPGEEQGQGVRLRRQVEVLEKSALGLGHP